MGPAIGTVTDCAVIGLEQIACNLEYVHRMQHWRNRRVCAILRAPPPTVETPPILGHARYVLRPSRCGSAALSPTSARDRNHQTTEE